jgi:peptidyl-prolyl cis-trans isomerase A (cyclophilin A)
MAPTSVVLGIPILLLSLVVGCGGEPEAPPADDSAAAVEEAAAPTTEAAGPDVAAPDAAPDEAPTATETELAPLLDPDHPEMNQRAPDRFRARFRTTAGDFVIQVHRNWAPLGADRFYNLVRHGFYDDSHFFRVIDGFVAQFGLSGNPEVSAAWSFSEIRDDPVSESNRRGTVTFATGGPNTRTTQLFINLGNNTNLDSSGFSPFGEVVEGMEVVDRLYSGYGDGAPYGSGPDQGLIERRGKAYLEREFPQLDRIERARIE